MAVLELLSPVFLIIVLGAALCRVGLMPAELIGGINRLLYWVGLPIAVFHSLVVADPEPGGTAPLVTVLLVATALSVAVAGAWTLLFRVPSGARGTFVQAGFRGNLVFVGLPLLLTIPAVPAAPAVMALMPMLIVYNAIAVLLLLAAHHELGWQTWRPLTREIVRNPIILSSVAGALWHHAGWVLPRIVERPLDSVAKMALPLALLCIGAALMTVPLRGNRRIATVAALHKVAVSPLIGYGIGRLMGLDAPAMLAVLIYLACPTAAISYTMVRQIGGDEAVAASVVVISAVLSVPALAVILAFFAV